MKNKIRVSEQEWEKLLEIKCLITAAICKDQNIDDFKVQLASIILEYHDVTDISTIMPLDKLERLTRRQGNDLRLLQNG